jgi:hypothetical protein
VIAENTFQKWWQRRAGQREARATRVSNKDTQGASNDAMPGTPRQSGPEWLLDGVVGLANISADIGCALRLAKNHPGSCHFGNYFW